MTTVNDQLEGQWRWCHHHFVHRGQDERDLVVWIRAEVDAPPEATAPVIDAPPDAAAPDVDASPESAMPEASA
jgi:hypothetical protein